MNECNRAVLKGSSIITVTEVSNTKLTFGTSEVISILCLRKNSEFRVTSTIFQNFANLFKFTGRISNYLSRVRNSRNLSDGISRGM